MCRPGKQTAYETQLSLYTYFDARILRNNLRHLQLFLRLYVTYLNTIVNYLFRVIHTHNYIKTHGDIITL